MTHRTLTTIALRFAALLLFMKIFDSFGAYFYSVLMMAWGAFNNDNILIGINKFYVHGTFLAVMNVVVSSLLFFKAEWIATRLIKTDQTVTANISAGELIRIILLTTGVLWLVSLIFVLPDLFAYIETMVARFNKVHVKNSGDFSPVYFLAKLFFALLFILRSEKIAVYIERKMRATPTIPEKTERSDEAM